MRDVFGLVITHAMAEKVSVIASFEGAIPEIIEHGIHGFLFPKGDEVILSRKILKLAGDPLLRLCMGEVNRLKFLEQYSPAVYGRRMIDVFKSFA